MTCTCGHEEDEHGGDVAYPGSSRCNIDDCDCCSFDWDGEFEEEEE